MKVISGKQVQEAAGGVETGAPILDIGGPEPAPTTPSTPYTVPGDTPHHSAL